MVESMRGRLLVASPTLRDDNFARTVVLLLEHTDEGAVGVVLTRPLPLTLAEAVPDWAPLAADPPVVFYGGPVAPGSAIALALARPGGTPPEWQPVLNRLGVVDLAGDATAAVPALEAVRVYSGYAGWGAGQLEWELGLDSWFVVDADPLDPFDPNPSALWRAVLRREGGQLARYALFPEDPSLN